MKNHISIIGFIDREPELAEVNGDKVCNLRIGTTNKFVNSNNKNCLDIQWHNISIWGKDSERVFERYHKGDVISLEGELRYKKNKEGLFPYIRATKVF